MINAKAETLPQKPAFKKAFEQRRCIVPVSGFFEWRKQGDKKQPFYIKHRMNDLLAVAVIWEDWQGKEGEHIKSCCLITTEANDFLSDVHHRMPVILDQKKQNTWLNPESDKDELQNTLLPYQRDDLIRYPVTPKMNNARFKLKDAIGSISKE